MTYQEALDNISKNVECMFSEEISILQKLIDEKTVAFLCDGKQCELCREPCKHTFDVKHAKNFECIEGTKYFERGEE